MRNFISIVESQTHYPERLDGSDAIANYVVGLDPRADFDSVWEMADDEFKDCYFELRLVPIADIRPGHPDGNRRIASKEKKFAKMATDAPPLLLGWQNEVLDGNHRYRVAIDQGREEVVCYVPVDPYA